MRNKFSVLLLIILISVSNLWGQGLTSKQIDSLVNKAMETMPHAGIAIAVVKDNKIVHMKGYGVTNIKTKEKVDENTLFMIASNSKAFTTMALAILVEQGKLNWTDKVIDYIPEFKMYDPYVTENFMITDLVTHRSGLALGAGDLIFFPDGSDFTIKDVLNSFQYQKPVSAFRTEFAYDNLLFLTAGEVIARVSRMTCAKFIEKYIMQPIGMNRSAGFYDDLPDKTNIASPHSVIDGKIKLIDRYKSQEDILGAAAGIYSSVNDMAKWLMLNLNNGKYGKDLEEQIVSEKEHSKLWRMQTIVNFNPVPYSVYKTHYDGYGLGWFLSDKAGYLVAEHTGGMPGMLSRVILIPDLKVGIVILTNAAPGGLSFWTLGQAIMDSYLGLEPTDWIARAEYNIKYLDEQDDSVKTAVWNIIKNANVKDIDFNNFVGDYRDNWFGDITIYTEDGKLRFKSLKSPKLSGEMYYYQANTFLVHWNYQDMPCDAFAMFILDENSRAVGFKMKAVYPSTDFSFDFQDLDLKRVE